MKTKLTTDEIKSFGKKLETIFADYGYFCAAVGSYDTSEDSIVFKIKSDNHAKVYGLLLDRHNEIMTSAGGREMYFSLKDGLIELQFERPVVKLNS